jgi:four helix bundle protein
VKNYRDLIVWQKAMKLVTGIYKHTKSFPEDERYGLTSQLRRSSVSLPSNMQKDMAEIQHKIIFVSCG